MHNKKESAFTLVELLVVIAIIGLIATLSVIALGNARSKSRDSKRVSDIKQVQTALELFFNDQGRYPTAVEWNTGSLYATGPFGTTTYIERIPTAPIGGSCSNDYSYAPNSTGDDYTINFCLESDTGSLTKGLNFAKAASLGKSDHNLVGWWMLDSVSRATDLSGNGSACSLLGEIILGNTSNNRQQVNGATIFDGVDDYISCPNNSSLNISDQISISLWVKSPNYSGSEDLFNKYYYDWAFRKGSNNNGNFQFMLRIDSNYQTTYYANPTYLWNDTWHNISGTYDGSNIKTFVDGQLVATSVSVSGAVSTSSGPLNIGYSNSVPSFFTGTMSDIRIYNRALSASEVKAIYDSTK